MEDKVRRKRNLGGVYLAGAYVVLAAALCSLGAYATFATPSPGDADFGYQWIPLLMLAWPWSEMNQNLLIFGLIVNTIFLWAIGSLIETIRRGEFMKK